MTRLFLDTEWADAEGDHLVSLALVSKDGQHRFYAEVDPLPAQPTQFVREVVYPLLERGSAAMSLRALTEQLRAFIASLEAPRFVLHDYHHDAVLMQRAMSGYQQPWAAELEPAPAVNYGLLPQGELKIRVETYFEIHPEAKVRRHHAGVDAEALRRAFRSAVHGESIEN